MLFALGSVITALADGKSTYVPYRNSKLSAAGFAERKLKDHNGKSKETTNVVEENREVGFKQV